MAAVLFSALALCTLYWLFIRVIEPAAFLMTRRMLLGLKHRAEALSVAPGERSSQAA